MKQITNCSRYLVGILFIISGAIKANDPLGFSYKLEEFYEVFGNYLLLKWFNSPLFLNTTLEAAVFMCVLEITIGFAFLSGAWPRIVSWVSLLLMIWFTFLTAFAAISGQITDCGCFGDAVKLSNWASFWKDIALLIFIGLIFLNRKKIKPAISHRFASLVALGGLFLALAFALHCIYHLPVKDFRPYFVSSNVCENRVDIPDQLKFFYVLKNKNSGDEQEFESFPADYESNWEFVESRTEVLKKGKPAKIINFRLTNEEGEEITDSLLELEGFKMMIVMYNINKTQQGNMESVNDLADKLMAEGIPVFGVTSSSDADIDAFKQETGSIFPFLVGDEVELKTMVRANPGIILMKGCIIEGKWNAHDTPSFERLQKDFLP